MADLCEYWKKNRAKGRMPNAVRAALLMLANECMNIEEQQRRETAEMMNELCGPKAFARERG